MSLSAPVEPYQMIPSLSLQSAEWQYCYDGLRPLSPPSSPAPTSVASEDDPLVHIVDSNDRKGALQSSPATSPLDSSIPASPDCETCIPLRLPRWDSFSIELDTSVVVRISNLMLEASQAAFYMWSDCLQSARNSAKYKRFVPAAYETIISGWEDYDVDEYLDEHGKCRGSQKNALRTDNDQNGNPQDGQDSRRDDGH